MNIVLHLLLHKINGIMSNAAWQLGCLRILLFIYLFGIHFHGTHLPKGGASNTKQQSYKVIKGTKIYKVEELGAFVLLFLYLAHFTHLNQDMHHHFS